MEETSSNNKRNRDQESSEELIISPAEKRLRSDLLLEIFDDDNEAGSEECLASVMKSLEEEITLPSPLNKPPDSNSGELRQPDLGFLLEASDDELGLPPTVNSSEKDVDDEGFGQIWGFADEFSGFYDGFEYSACDDFGVLHGELFGYEDQVYASSDLGEMVWRPETLPAV